MGNFRTSYRQIDSTAPKGQSQWKDGLPVDSTGVIPDGKAFAGVQELRSMLVKQPDQLARGVTRHLLTYATGQPAAPLDQSTIEAIVNGAAKDDYGLRSLVHGIVQSETFRSK